MKTSATQPLSSKASTSPTTKSKNKSAPFFSKEKKGVNHFFNSPQIQRKSLGDIPEDKRKKIRVITKPVIHKFEEFFKDGTSFNMGGTTIDYGKNVPTDAAWRKSIKSVAGKLKDDPLVENSTVTIQLDLTNLKKGNHVYRFTFVGTEIIAENLGKMKSITFSEDEKKALEKKVSDKKIKIQYFKEKKELVLQALSLLSDNELNRIYGVTIEKQSGTNPENAGVGGQYDPDTHTITMYDFSFQETKIVSDTGKGFISEGTRNIIHEIGHAIDLQPLGAAWKKYTKTDGSPISKGEVKKREGQLVKTQSESGYKWTKTTKIEKDDEGKKKKKIIFEQLRSDKAKSDFITAAKADGAKKEPKPKAGKKPRMTEVNTEAQISGGITSYSESDWMELYAENYSMYKGNPSLLKLIRPKIFEFFEKLKAKKFDQPKKEKETKLLDF